MNRYVVKYFSDTKGYGHAYTPFGDALIHHREMINVDGWRTLDAGDIVCGVLVASPRGYRLIQVTKDTAPPPEWAQGVAALIGWSRDDVMIAERQGRPCPVERKTWGDLRATVLAGVLPVQ